MKMINLCWTPHPIFRSQHWKNLVFWCINDPVCQSKLKQTLCTSYLHAPHKPVKYISLSHVSTSNFCMWKCIVSWCKYYFTLYFSFHGRRQEITRLWSNHDKPGWVPILILKSSKLLFLLRKAVQNILSSVSDGGKKTTTTNDEKLKIVTKNIHL